MFKLILIMLLGLFLRMDFTSDIVPTNGYFINTNGDTTFVIFKFRTGPLHLLPGGSAVQGGFKYYVNAHEDAVLLEPKDAKEVSFTFDNKPYRYFSAPMSWNRMTTDVLIFLEATEIGYCKAFNYYASNDAPYYFHQSKTSGFRKGDGESLSSG